jgi:hypothetical protein
MQLVIDFQTIEQHRPEDNQHCLIVYRLQPGVIHSAVYDAKEDVFYLTDHWSYPANEVSYWTKASF